MKQLIPLLAILGAAARPAVASPADTGAAAERPGWQRVAAAEEQGQCQFVLPPFAEPQQAPAAVMLATNSPDFVMVTVAGPRYKDYTAGSNYRAEVMVEGEGVLSPAMVQHSEDGTIGMVAMAIPVDRLADWGATDRMVLRLDGRK